MTLTKIEVSVYSDSLHSSEWWVFIALLCNHCAARAGSATPPQLSHFFHHNMPDTFFSSLCIWHPPRLEYFFLCVCGLIEWLWSGRSVSQWKFKPPADLCKLHLVRGCYKLDSLFSLWCQWNRGCHEVRGLGNVSYQGWDSPLSWYRAHGTNGGEWETRSLRR